MRYLPIERKHYRIVFLKHLPFLQIHLLVMQPEQQGGAKLINKSLFIWMTEDTKNTFPMIISGIYEVKKQNMRYL